MKKKFNVSDIDEMIDVMLDMRKEVEEDGGVSNPYLILVADKKRETATASFTGDDTVAFALIASFLKSKPEIADMLFTYLIGEKMKAMFGGSNED